MPKSTVFTEQPTKEIKPYFLKQDPAQDLTNTEAPGGCRAMGREKLYGDVDSAGSRLICADVSSC